MRRFLNAVFASVLAVSAQAAVSPDALEWRPEARWRGFNLLEMFVWSPERTSPAFLESDFALIREWGFNFVRLPLDYRFWTHGGDWHVVDEGALKPIDEAIAFGRKYGIHVQICFHRAPGYCINRCEIEPKFLFKGDPDALETCCRHWAVFARRYRGFSNAEVSFDLMNEPPGVSEGEYGKVVRELVAAIRAEDPKRLIFSDGRHGGNVPTFSLADVPGLCQAGRGYRPFDVSHYKAEWVHGAWTKAPVWPVRLDDPDGILAGPAKKSMRCPFTIAEVPACRLELRFGRVSGPVDVRVSGDGRVLREIRLEPRPGAEGWRDVRYYPEWRIHQGAYTNRVDVSVDAPVGELAVETVSGDWAALASVALVGGDGRRAELEVGGGFRKGAFFARRFAGWDASAPLPAAHPEAAAARRYPDDGRELLYRTNVKAWEKLAAKGVTVMVGECGAYNKTPHDVVLAWMEDNLRLWEERGWGWALWNLRGSFGVLDSGRADVDYEDFRGHRLDRKLLDVLRRH